jgi:hypothetical protein
MAEYINRHRDIVVATDSRWVTGEIGHYTVEDDDGLKSLDLGPDVAIAFTGHAEAMAGIVGELYGDKTLLKEPQRDVLKRLEGRSHHLGLDLEAIAGVLDKIVLSQMCSLGTGYTSSIILAGEGRSGPTMYYWSKEANWVRIENPPSCSPRVRTLPPEAQMGTAIQKQADSILDGHGNWNARIQRAVSFLAKHKDVQSVGGSCVFRRMGKGFARRRNSPAPDPSASPSHACVTT